MQKKEDWSVAFLCLFVMMSVYGIQRTSSVFFVEVANRFNITKEVASVPFTTLFLFEVTLGPFACYLGIRYDLYAIVCLGCFLEACGIALNFLAQDIITVILFWGVLQGIGEGLVASLIFPIVGNNYERYFSTACGIAMSGISIGGIVLPIISKALIETYSVSGAFLIIGGLILHTVPIMMMIRCIASTNKKAKMCKKHAITSISGRKLNDYLEPQSSAICKHDSLVKNNASKQSEKHSKTSNSRGKPNNEIQPQSYETIQIENSMEISQEYESGKKHPISVKSANRLNDFPKPQSCPDSQTDNISENTVPTVNCDQSNILSLAIDSNQSDVQQQNVSLWYPFRVFLDPTFIAMLLVQGSLKGIFGFINTMIVDLYLEKNVLVTNGIYILSGISASHIVGSVSIGRLGDSGIMSEVNIAIVCLISMMFSYLSLVWGTGFVACLLPSLVHGLFSSGLAVISIAIIKKYSKKEFMMIALALKNVLAIPFSVCIPSTIGFFKDRNGSYDGIMYILSGICFVCCFVTYFIPCLSRRRDTKKL